MTPALPVLTLLTGVILLFFGRRLFWLLVAAIGFALGMQLAPNLMQQPPIWLELAVALVLGIIGAVLALILQKIAIALAGFLLGGHLATAIMTAFVHTQAQYPGVTFVIGGIVGALLLVLLFNWALIVFSSIAGAELITSHLHLPATGATVLLLALALLGIIVQSTLSARRRIA